MMAVCGEGVYTITTLAWKEYRLFSCHYLHNYSQSSLFKDSIFVNSSTHYNLFVTQKSRFTMLSAINRHAQNEQ